MAQSKAFPAFGTFASEAACGQLFCVLAYSDQGLISITLSTEGDSTLTTVNKLLEGVLS